ncbi:zinc finger CCHC domain-containing protein [Acrasis kona]|uniref:Zinc finger CCHC domain-containing protein n=1 Tax=Acrasis kona TaxID=1008807 RepID=A0AAW2Z2Y3_9EUKA
MSYYQRPATSLAEQKRRRDEEFGTGNQQCQKCLQYGHWTYECKNQRVHLVRPSRSKRLEDRKNKGRDDEDEHPTTAPPTHYTPYGIDTTRFGKLVNLSHVEPEQSRNDDKIEKKKDKKKKRKYESSDSSSSDSSSSNSGSDYSSSSEDEEPKRKDYRGESRDRKRSKRDQSDEDDYKTRRRDDGGHRDKYKRSPSPQGRGRSYYKR